MTTKPEERESLWWLAAAPSVWALHFVASYATVAIWCAKAVARDGPLGAAWVAVLVYTVVALVVVATIGWIALRRHRFGMAKVPHDLDTSEDRHRFLGFATLLLSVMSAVAIAYVALPLFFIRTCR